MKTIFITAGEGTAARYFLRSGLLRFLAENSFRVVLLVPERSHGGWKQEFECENVLVEGIPQLGDTLSEKILLFLSRTAFRTRTNTHTRMREHYARGKNIGVVYLKEFLSRVLGHIEFVRVFVRWRELSVRPHPVVSRLFEKYKPDLVYVTIIVNDVLDIPILREAKRRSVRTVASTRNWDNFTTFGFLLLVPDQLVVQNEFLKDKAIQLHAVPADSVSVAGFPHFDWYLKRELVIPREEFCRKLGIDPRKKIILYGAMGDWLFSHEGEIADIFEEAAESGMFKFPSVLIFRAHPAFRSPLRRMKNFRHVVADSVTGVEYAVGNPEVDWNDLVHFINSVYHSDIVVTAASTVGLDAVVFDKPVISVNFDGTSTPAYWLSARRFHDHFTHWIDFMRCGGARRADSRDEFIQALNAYLENPQQDASGRECIRRRFAGAIDATATKRLADILIHESR